MANVLCTSYCMQSYTIRREPLAAVVEDEADNARSPQPWWPPHVPASTSRGGHVNWSCFRHNTHQQQVQMTEYHAHPQRRSTVTAESFIGEYCAN